MAVTINASTSTGLVQTADTSGVLQLQTNSGTTAVTIDTSQNVGIGTTSPSIGIGFNTLKVKGVGAGGVGTAITESTDGASWLQLYSGASTSDDPTFIYPTGKVLRFGTGTQNTSSYTERMRIDSSGNLLVACTAEPSASVKGWSLRTYASGVYAASAVSSTGTLTHYAFINTNGQVGRIDTSGSATSYVTSSDYRLKDDIIPMTGALDKVAKLKPVSWKWKVDGTDGEGFIAHELAEVSPHAVSGEKDAVDAEGNPVYQGIDTSFLVATLTAAIQEQTQIINDLKARITALEGAA